MCLGILSKHWKQTENDIFIYKVEAELREDSLFLKIYEGLWRQSFYFDAW